MTPIRRNTVIVGYAIGCAIGLALSTDRERVVVWPTAVLWLAALGVGLYAAHARYLSAGAQDRRRMQWIGLGMWVAAEAAIVVVALRLVTDWPRRCQALLLSL